MFCSVTVHLGLEVSLELGLELGLELDVELGLPVPTSAVGSGGRYDDADDESLFF